ncbi:hypothetical protein OOJ96_06565 [Pseudomonas sp. 15FMM2]|uniref:Uncharacterized protein n=1 Tax=Pseudomonas imrae TaxID=2992837 RepID=A0ACC7P9W7_9PSED
MASAGGKISFASEEVQPGATHFLLEMRAVRQENYFARQKRLPIGAFTSEFGGFCSEKEQKQAVCRKTHLGATNSLETGCTLFALLNSIRA